MGTIINVAAIILGGVFGHLFGRLLSERYQDTLNKVCGVSVLFIGIAGALEGMLTVSDNSVVSGKAMLIVLSLVLGAIIGELLNIEDKFERFGEWLKKKTGNDVSNYERLSYFIDEYKHLFEPEDITDIDKLKKELNSLRNHYIHEGYYLPNNQFSVTEKRKILYYKDMDYHWLYRITQALKEGAYIILYTKVLNLDIDDRKLKYALRTIK